jgi:hypothetical protein
MSVSGAGSADVACPPTADGGCTGGGAAGTALCGETPEGTVSGGAAGYAVCGDGGGVGAGAGVGLGAAVSVVETGTILMLTFCALQGAAPSAQLSNSSGAKISSTVIGCFDNPCS